MQEASWNSAVAKHSQFFVLFIHIKGERKKREKDEKQAHGKKRESGSLELAWKTGETSGCDSSSAMKRNIFANDSTSAKRGSYENQWKENKARDQTNIRPE